MNANIAHWAWGCSAVLALIVLHPGCSDRSMNSKDTQNLDLSDIDGTQASGIQDIENIIWTLDKSGYEPFQLIFNDEQFYGYDGCNWFGGRYEAQNDSIFPREVVQTERGCQVRTFPVEHLGYPFRMRIAKNELRLFTPDATLTFESNVSASIDNSPLIRNWMLTASTDPEFPEIQAQQLIPMLSFNENREFKIAWYCISENTFGCDEIAGIFGIGEDGRISFYKAGWKNHAQGLDFMERILNSTSYGVESGTSKEFSLTLVEKNSGTSFQFSAISQSTQ